MEETIEIAKNDTVTQIENLIAKTRAFESPYCDPRVKALVITNLEVAQMWAFKMIKTPESTVVCGFPTEAV